MNLNLENKKVLITGSSKGIGKGIAESFLNEKSKVFLVSRKIKNLQKTCKSLSKKYYSQILYEKCDCCIIDDLKNLKSEVKKQWNNLDFLIINVGNGSGSNQTLPSLEEWNSSLNENLLSAFYTVKILFSLIRNGGSIVFISSIAGEEVIGAPTEYSVFKNAIFSLSKNLSYKNINKIRVNTISPGNILFKNGSWDLKIKNNSKKVSELINQKVPLKKFGKPSDIGNAVVFLCSERASFINGAVLRIDGGQTVKI